MLKLSYTESVNSNSIIAINSTSVVNATFIETTTFTPIVNDGAYNQIEFDVDITYDGTETNDVLTIGGRLNSVTDSDKWTVQVYNGDRVDESNRSYFGYW